MDIEAQELKEKHIGFEDISDPEKLLSWSSFMDHAGAGAWVCDLSTGVIHYSVGWADMLGYEPDELKEMLDPWTELIHPEDRARVITLHLEHVEKSSGYYECEQRLKHKSGEYRWVLSRCRVEMDRRGRAVRSCGYQIDITDLKSRLQEQGAQASQRNSYVAQAPIHVAVFDRKSREFVFWSRSEDAEGLWKMVPPDREGAMLLHLMYEHPGAVLPLTLTGDGGTCELFELDENEDMIGVLIRERSLESTALAQAHALIGRMHAKKTELKVENRSLESLARSLQEAQSRFERLSLVDSLTGLLNRRAFEEHLEDALESQANCVVVLLDIDHFKKINDTLGHPVGDAVLREASRTLKSFVRPGQELSRIGGEEFAWLMTGVTLQEGAELAEKARTCFEAESWACGSMTISAGVAERIPGESALTIIQRADQALYTAKRKGRNRVSVAPSSLTLAA